MDDRVKSCCASFYELPIIETLLGNQWHPGGPALTRKLANAVMIGRGSSVLDVACGRGESARVLAAHFGCHVVGIDYSLENTTRANVLAAEAGLMNRVRFVRGDAERLPFDAGTFDVVICECSLCLFPHISTALDDFHRVLRPGGYLGISDIVLNEPVPESLQDLFGHVFCIGGALSIDGYHDAFAAAGYSSVRIRDTSSALNDMITRIDSRARAAKTFVDTELFELLNGWNVPRSSIVESRDFVTTGGVGYALITGRKPRAQ